MFSSNCAEVIEDDLLSDDIQINFKNNEKRLRIIIKDHLDRVARVLRNAGVNENGLDDEIQRTFITIARRLDDIKPYAEKAFVIQTALRIAMHFRWAMARRREIIVDDIPEEIDIEHSPELLTDQKHMRNMFDRIIDKMDTDLKFILILYEFEEMKMIDIAKIYGVSKGTILLRLRKAHTQFRKLFSELDFKRTSKIGYIQCV